MSKSETINCVYCQSEKVKKDGTRKSKQRYYCNECERGFTEDSNGGFELNSNEFRLEEKDNGAVLTINTVEPKTTDELLEIFGIDLDVWRVDKSLLNKTYKQNLPFYQIKVNLSKIVPDKLKFPVVKPLNINSSVAVHKTVKSNNKFKKALIIPDIQAGFNKDLKSGKLDPFHDRKCLDISLKISSELKPDVIVLLGDNLDFNEQSEKFVKKPEFYFTTQAAIIELGWYISQLRLLNPKAEIVYLEGNHEARGTRSIINNMIWAYGLKSFGDLSGDSVLSIENLLGLKKSNVTYLGDYPNGEYWINDNLKVVHGTTVKNGSGDTVKEVLKNTRYSQIQGHVHRMEIANKTVHSKDKIISYCAASLGCFCRLDGIVPSFGGDNNWQQGFGVVEYQEGNGAFQIMPYYINDGMTLFNGKIVEAEEDKYLKHLKKDTNWKF